MRPAAAIGSVVFFLVGPGVEAGLAPWVLTGWRAGQGLPGSPVLRALGAALITAGVLVLVWGFARFAAEGAGTPSPAAPAQELVVSGPYRHVRNPMYLASAAAIAGQALVLRRPVLLLAAAAFLLAFAAAVRIFEEPLLARRFGAAYERYRGAVPAWLPRLRPWAGP